MAEIAWQDALQARLALWRADPVRFVEECLGGKPVRWQREALEALASGKKRLAIRSGHGVGKSTFLAWVMLWFMYTHLPHKIMATANRQDQLSDVLWAECKAWHKCIDPVLRDFIEFTTDRIFWKAAPERGFSMARTARKENPEAFQGAHQKHMLLIADEASGIDEIIFETGVGAMSTPGAITILTGNPTRAQGYFYEAFHSMEDMWWKRRVSVQELIDEGASYVDPNFPADVAKMYGVDDNRYRVRILGDFPSSDDDQVIPKELIDAAMVREVDASKLYREVWGVDVARYGDDRSALCKRRGNVLVEDVRWWEHKDTMQTAAIVKNEWLATPVENRPSEIFVDVIGLGAGVADKLWHDGLPAVGVNVSESPSAKDQYGRLRDELWFRARGWFAARDCRMTDAVLGKELRSVLYTIPISGKTVVESKSDMKKRGMRSPDLADAFILTFAGGVDLIEDHELEKFTRYSIERKMARRGSWMTA